MSTTGEGPRDGSPLDCDPLDRDENTRASSAGERAAAADERIPFVDLQLANAAVNARVLEDVAELLDAGAFTNGPQVAAFERAFARYVGTAHCVGVSSGLDALRLALIAGGIDPGDEVVVPASTFVASFEAVTQAGGTPVVVDVTETDYGLDPVLAEQAVTAAARFLLPVHLYGQMADMRSLTALAARRGLAIVEDACQAHGAERDGLRAGAAGSAGSFSFYPTKNLGAMGDAGALVTDDGELAGRVRALREHGQTSKYRHEREGYTARLDTIQAIALLRKLPLLDGWNDERKVAAAFYTHSLAGIGDLRLPPVPSGSDPVWHVYVVRTGDPSTLADFLAARGIATGRHYPEPPHLSPAYGGLGLSRGSFPVSEALAREALSLPVYPGISERQLTRVCRGIAAFFAGG